jgi:hypothetical protein
MTGSIGFKVTLGTSTNNFVAALYDSSNVGTVLESILVPKSGGLYPPSFQVTFTTNLLQDTVYRVILWETAGTTPGGISRISDDFKASLNSIKLREKLYLTADVSPGLVSGTSGYVDPTSSLEGWGYWLEQVGYGTLEDGAGKDITLDPTTNDWTLINGTTVQPEQKFVIHFAPQISVAAQPPVSQITSGLIITANLTLTSAHKNKALILRSSSSTITTPLPALSTLADFDRIIIYSMGGSHINAVIPTQGTDTIVWFNAGINVVTRRILGQNEKLELFKFTDPGTGTSYYWVDGDLSGVARVGEIFESEFQGYVNAHLLDGSVLQRDEYPRLYERIPPEAFIAEASWANTDSNGNFINKGYFTQGNGTTTFRIPDLRIYPSRRAVNGTSRAACSFEMATLLLHNHLNGVADDKAAGDSVNVFVYGQSTAGMPGNAHGNLANTGGGSIYQGLTSNAGTLEQKNSNTGVFVMIRI